MKLLNKILHSISGRLTTHVLMVSALLYLVAFSLLLNNADKNVKAEAEKHAQSELKLTISEIDKVLKSVEVAVENIAWIVPEQLDNPDFMYFATKQLLTSNPFIFGSAIAFEPNYYPEKGLFYSPYSYRDNNEIKTKQLGNDDYDYFCMDWYQIPKLLNQSFWSEPYYDEGGGDMMMTTYSRPLYDENGKIYAIITADISLEWLTKLVSDIHAFPNSYNIMTGRGATYIVHPDPEIILNETIFTATYDSNDDAANKMRDDMVNGRSGYVLFKKNETNYYIYYSSVEKTNWSVAIVCPEDEVYANVNSLRTTVIIIGIVALLIMIVLCYNIIRYITGPIEKCTIAAVKIARGEFNTPLPDVKHQDEIQMLRNSFEHMQLSLTKHMDALKANTIEHERHASELRIANAIQQGMLPKEFPIRPDIDLYARIDTAKVVGGDLYDFFIIDEKLYFIVGDVSGKGIPASLVMAVTCRLFRSVASSSDCPEQIMNALNASLSDGNESNMFCTAFLGILDLKTGLLKYCNAGHNAPVIIRHAQEPSFMKIIPNIPLGIFDNFSYTSESITLDNDTAIFIYTDGITEAENNIKQLYSDNRLLELLNVNKSVKAQEIIDIAFNSVKEFANGAKQSDDITVLAFRYNSISSAMKCDITLQNEKSEIEKIAPFVDKISDKFGLPLSLNFNLNLVLEEALINIISYAYPNGEKGEIALSAKLIENKIMFEITDSGIEFDPTKVQKPNIELNSDERPIGGLGVFIIHQIMDQVQYQRIDGKNVLTLIKSIE